MSHVAIYLGSLTLSIRSVGATPTLIAAALGLLLLPTLVLGAKFTSLKLGAVAIAENERASVEALRPLVDMLTAFQRPYLPPSNVMLLKSRLQAATARFETAFDLDAFFSSLPVQHSDYGTRKIILDSIRHVAEKSDPILDPELDSYHLMSLKSERLPMLIFRLGILAQLAAQPQQLMTANALRAEQFDVALRNVADAADEARRTLHAAMAADRTTSRRLAQLRGRQVDLDGVLRDIEQAFRNRPVLTAEIGAELEPLVGRALSKTAVHAANALNELDGLPSDHIAQTQSSLLQGLALPALTTPAAMVASMRALKILVGRLDDRIVYLAERDSLTGLHNRSVFLEVLNRIMNATKENSTAAVLYLDLDRFKYVNDTLGHPIGDELLCQVAARITAATKSIDVVARLGGDEFAVILMSKSPSGAAVWAAERLLATLSEPFEINGHLVSIGASIGLALPGADAHAASEIMRFAGIALYDAKSSGRGTFRFFEKWMDSKARDRQELEAQLRRAMAAKQFHLHFQPLVEAKSNSIVACEALLRWTHPDRSPVPPAVVIPIAEHIGVIDEIGNWVLEEACLTATTWPSHVNVAVNVSSVQFRSRDFTASVRGALERSGLDPGRLELEITESVLLQDNGSVMKMLADLKSLGVRIALDDFGTGYSSLSYLQRFPFDKLIIDRSFVSDLDAGHQPTAIIRAVAELVESLGMVTTAEGVETPAQSGTLERLGCTEIQGSLVSRPLPVEAMARFMRSETEDHTLAA